MLVMSSNMAVAKQNTLYNFGNIETKLSLLQLTSPKLWLESQGNLTQSWPSSIHFWSQKKWYCYLRGFCGHATSWWKPSIEWWLIYIKATSNCLFYIRNFFHNLLKMLKVSHLWNCPDRDLEESIITRKRYYVVFQCIFTSNQENWILHWLKQIASDWLVHRAGCGFKTSD